MPGKTSILIENSKCIINIVEHIIKVHKRKRIVYIKGPEQNDKAQLCFKAFKKAMIRNNCPIHEELIYKGNFGEDSGAAEFIQKPYSLLKLTETVSKAMNPA